MSKQKQRLRQALERSKRGLGLPIHIEIPLILINIEYQELVLDKPFIRVYYIKFPIRIRGFPHEIRGLPSGIGFDECRLPSRICELLSISIGWRRLDVKLFRAASMRDEIWMLHSP